MADFVNELDNVMADLKGAVDGTLDAPEPKSAEPEVTTDAAPEPVETATPARERDPATGRFIPKAGETQEQADAAGAKDTPVQAAAPAAPEFPQHWSAGDKELFGKLPADQRKAIVDRFLEMEKGFQPKLQEFANYQREFGPVVQLFQPHMNTLRQKGLTMNGVIKAWADTEMALANPQTAEATIRRLAQNYGVKLDAASPAEQPQEYIDPQIAAIKAQFEARLEQLTGSLTAVQQAEKNRLEAEQARQLAEYNNQVQAFAQAKDERGNLKYPHYDKVQPGMVFALRYAAEQGLPMSLEQAYQQAVLLNPEVSQAVQTAQQAAAETKRQAQARAKAEQARHASTGIGASNSAATPAAGSVGSATEDLWAAYRARRTA